MGELVGLLPLVFVGVDWGSVEHRVVVLDAAGKQMREWTSRHSGEALRELADRLAAFVEHASSCRVAIEVKAGPIVEALLERGLSVYAVNPRQTDRFRDRYMPSGAKDDRRDAFVLANAVRTDAEQLARLSSRDRRTIALSAALRLRHELVDDRTRLLLRLREQLWRYYAQMIEIADGEFDSPWLWALWEKAPTPAEGALLKKVTVARILKDHRVRRIDADAVLAALRKPALVVADGVPLAACRHIHSIIPRLRLLSSQIREVQTDIEQQVELWSKLDSGPADSAPSSSAPDDPDEPRKREQRDEVILRSLPGVGLITLATLLAEVREPLERRDYATLRLLCGVAPITRQSGGSKVVLMRRACSEVLRNATFNWARSAVRFDAHCATRFANLRARGAKPARAYRSVADHLLRVACAMLRDNTEYRLAPRSNAA